MKINKPYSSPGKNIRTRRGINNGTLLKDIYETWLLWPNWRKLLHRNKWKCNQGKVQCQCVTHLQLTDFGVRNLESFRQILFRLLGLFHSSVQSARLVHMEKSSKKFDICLTIRIDLSVPGTYFLPFLFNTYLKLSLNFSPVNQRQKDLKFRDTGRSRRLRDATIITPVRKRPEVLREYEDECKRTSW